MWIDGRIRGEKDAKVSVFDRGFLYGDGAFETMRSYAGVIFRLNEHLARLFKTLEALRIKCPYTRQELAASIRGALGKSGIKGAYLRLSVTRGCGRAGIGIKTVSSPGVVLIIREYKGYPETSYSRGIAAAVSDIRLDESSPLAGKKTLNFLTYIIAREAAERGGFDEAILMNTGDELAEAAAGNIFLVKGGRISTPSLDCGALPGITRGVVLSIAKDLRICVRQRRIPRRELDFADEVFLTNSLAEVIPITRIGSRRVGRGSPGEIAKLLHISYQKMVIREVAGMPGAGS